MKHLALIRWIDAAHELPDDETTVLLAASDGRVWAGFHYGNHWRYLRRYLVADPINNATVTHWAHLPEPPKPDAPRKTKRRPARLAA